MQEDTVLSYRNMFMVITNSLGILCSLKSLWYIEQEQKKFQELRSSTFMKWKIAALDSYYFSSPKGRERRTCFALNINPRRFREK